MMSCVNLYINKVKIMNVRTERAMFFMGKYTRQGKVHLNISVF